MADYDAQPGRNPPEQPELSAARREADEVDLYAGLTGVAGIVAGARGVIAVLGEVAEFARQAIPGVDGAGDHGAEVFRACVACHNLRADDGVRAGPTLAGIFGRRIATLPGYSFSPALKKLDIVWTPATLSKLFEIGPAAYTPGTKMPEQRIGSAEERERLVKFLERATKNN